jgi:nucleoside-diphosphate-sugar epimerase
MLGQAIVRQLSRQKDIVLMPIYRRRPPLEIPNVKAVTVDPNDRDQMTATVRQFQPSVVIHAAATGMQTPRPDTQTLESVNVDLPVQLAEMTAAVGNCSFTHVSSGLAYQDRGRPLYEHDPLDTNHPYGASKAAAERKLNALAQKHDLPLTIVRPFSFTGEGDFGTRLFPSLLRSAAEQTPFAMSAGDQVRDHSSVDDIAAGVVAAALTPAMTKTNVFNLGHGDTRSLRELVLSVIDQLNLNVEVKFGARLFAAGEPMFVVPNVAKAEAALGWRARENVAHAVWRLARKSFPTLNLSEPAQFA